MSGTIVGPVEFECRGPIATDPVNRAIRFRAHSNCYIDTRHTGEVLAPMSSSALFSVESWAKCGAHINTARYVLMTGR